jgi:hypothetical protein
VEGDVDARMMRPKVTSASLERSRDVTSMDEAYFVVCSCKDVVLYVCVSRSVVV